MTEATRNALVEIDRILQEADWDRSEEPASSLTEQEMDALRMAYHRCHREDHVKILQHILGNKSSIHEASQLMGLSAEEGGRLFAEALESIRDFAVITNERRPTPAASERSPVSPSKT